MVDLRNKTIEELFFSQMRDISAKTFGAKLRLIPRNRFTPDELMGTFDMQFSDRWLEV